tara:strand:- start:525 stop:1952 length:1428 start_codon:yes stop_codon:yes gene_type:complete
MAVGGGDEFSLAATLLTIILLWSLLQWTAPWWLCEMGRRQSISSSNLRQLDRTLTLLPLILLSIVTLDLIWSHYTLDLTHAHVANFGGEQYSSWERILASLFSEGSPWLAIPLFYSISSFACEKWFGFDDSLFGNEIESNQRAIVLRLHGLLWPFMLLAFVSSNSFAVFSESQLLLGSNLISPSNCIFLIIAGTSLGFWIHLTSKLSQHAPNSVKQLNFVLLLACLTLGSILALRGVLPKAKEWHQFSDSIAMGNEVNLALCASFALLLMSWPFFLFLLTKVHSIRGQARERRWVGLLHIFFHTLIFSWLSGISILYHLPNISSLTSAMWISLTLQIPLAVAGLLGALLPMAGLDARPRPEAWGFFLVMVIASLFFTIREPLTATLAPGLFVSMTSLPLLATHFEKHPFLSIDRRVIESFSLHTLSVLVLCGLNIGMGGSTVGFIIAMVALIMVPATALIFTKINLNLSKFGEEE